MVASHFNTLTHFADNPKEHDPGDPEGKIVEEPDSNFDPVKRAVGKTVVLNGESNVDPAKCSRAGSH